MTGQLGTPDDERTDRIGYLQALQGLIANRDAVESSMARLRKAAAAYTNEELMRFAQLIILTEHPPSDWREMQLARVRGREDALEEIAKAKGFLMVAASPLTRSSHHAGEDFARLQAAREAKDAAA